jgi:outer membrane lipoprotein-sorting protein
MRLRYLSIMNCSNFPFWRVRVFCIALLAWSSFAALAPSASAQTADEILAKVLAARGGADKIKAIHAERVSGKISFGPEFEGPFSVEFVRPLKMHMEISINGRNVVRVYDGKSSGWVINQFAENKDVQPMDAADLRNIADESDFDGPLVDYQSKGNHLELQGKDEVAGRQTYKLQLTNKNGDVRTYFFDASTFLLIKWEGKVVVDNHETPLETFFSDYRDIHGVKFAFEVDSDTPGSPQQKKITIEKIEIDPKIDEARFAKPAAPASAEPAAEAPPAPSSTPTQR